MLEVLYDDIFGELILFENISMLKMKLMMPNIFKNRYLKKLYLFIGKISSKPCNWQPQFFIVIFLPALIYFLFIYQF